MKEQDGGCAGDTCGGRVGYQQEEKKVTVGPAYNPAVWL